MATVVVGTGIKRLVNYGLWGRLYHQCRSPVVFESWPEDHCDVACRTLSGAAALGMDTEWWVRFKPGEVRPVCPRVFLPLSLASVSLDAY